MSRGGFVLRGLYAAAALTFTVACAGSGVGEGERPVGSAGVAAETCAPVEHALDETSTLARMAGTYVLTLASGGAEAASAEGRLTLEALPDALLEMGGASTPLAGTTDIDVEAVGALRMGDLESTDPMAPGVLVIETAGTNILLRLGSASNRRNEASFDGGYTVLSVTRIANGGFDGNWRSGSRDGTTRGYFCARPVGQ